MTSDPDLSRFASYSRIADDLIVQSSKEDVAQCARILAFTLAQYELRFGELPRSKYIAMLELNNPIDADMAEALTASMKHLVGVLGTLLRDRDEPSESH